MDNPRHYSAKNVLQIILFANFIVAAVKIGVGFLCDSRSIVADGIHSFADGSSNIIGLVGIWLASRPRDSQHPYGHDKYEVIASLFIGIMLAIISIKIIFDAMSSFQNPTHFNISYPQITLIILTIIVNTIVAITEYRCAKKLRSLVLMTDSLHTRSDIMISCTVLLGVIGIKYGMPMWIDGVLSLLVAVVVLKSAVQIVKNCSDILVDSKILNSEEIKSLLITIPGIYDIHQIRSRGELCHAFIDFHIIVNPQESIANMHALSHRLEEILREHFGSNTEVNIHIEPNDNRHG